MSNREARSWIYGFFLLGILVGPIGSLAIAWQYHIGTNPEVIGLHFLALNAGYAAAQAVSRRLLLRFPIRSVAVSFCLIGFLSFLSLSFAVPPVPVIWRVLGLGFTGLAGGGLAASLLYLLEPHFSRSTASAISYAGSLFGFGCTAATAIVAAAYFAGSVQMETTVLAAFPLLFALWFMGNRLPEGRQPFRPREEQERRRLEVQDLRSVAAVLFGLLIFFQSGNEWVLAGWLPLFLVHRLGANPVLAVLALAVYFLALTTGRLVVRPLLSRMDHRRLLLSSIAVAVAGYLLLSLTTSLTGAFLAVVITGLGFAPIYPLLAETSDDRFAYHVSFYHRIFSVAFTGAMCAPWLIGYVDSLLGARFIMLLPALGSVAVFILALLIMFEAHLMGSKKENNKPRVLAAAGGKN